MKKWITAAIFSGVLAFSAVPADALLYRASGGSDAVQDITNKVNQIIASAREAASALMGDANNIMEARLAQIDGIVDAAMSDLAAIPMDAETRTLNVLREAEKALLDLETKVFADVKASIYEAECAARRLTLNDLQAALGDLGDLVGLGKIKIDPPLPVEEGAICSATGFFCDGPPEFEIADNFERTAIKIRGYMLSSLGNMQDDDRAYAIPETYHYLALLARKTSCFVGSDANAWVEDHVRYTKAAQDWNKYVRPARN